MSKRKVSECFGCNSPNRTPHVKCGEKLIDSSVLIGLEVETENCNLSAEAAGRIPMWQLTLDHSLKSRQPYEFIFSSPYRGADVEQALKVLSRKLDRTPVCYPHNTSVHVHVDVSDMDTEELRTFLYLALTFESALIQVSGNRRNNVFCMQIGAGSITAVTEFGRAFDSYLNGEPYGVDVYSRSLKYSAVNPMPILTHGTLEFRTHEGTHDPDRLIKWINILLSLRKYAVEASKAGPAMLTVDYSTRGIPLAEFMREIWDEATVQEMLHDNLHHDVTQSSLAARMALFPKSRHDFWEEFPNAGRPIVASSRTRQVEQPSSDDSVEDLLRDFSSAPNFYSREPRPAPPPPTTNEVGVRPRRPDEARGEYLRTIRRYSVNTWTNTSSSDQ